MAGKQLLFRSAAREKVFRGAMAITDAIRITLGPKSKCVLIQKKWGKPVVCNDGVTIAKEVELENAEENLGAQMIREAAERTGDVVGDGTSTSAILTCAIFGEGLHNIAAGASAVDLKRGLERGFRAAVQELTALARPVTSRLEKSQVAMIAAHNDSCIGEMVADAVEKVGAEGVISVEEAKTTETTLDLVEGMQFERGYISPYFITDAAKMEAVLVDPVILICEKRITSLQDLLPLMEEISKAGKSLVVIAEDVDGEALATLVVNKVRGSLASVAIKAPGFGDRRKEMLQDLAVLTGGQVIAEELGIKMENVTLAQLGRAKRVVVDRDKTTIVEGAGAKESIQARCDDIRKQIQDCRSDYDREKLEERLAKLAGGVAVIRVGAPSEAEMKNRKEAFEDAISATKAAVAEGLVPGGGLAFLRVIGAVEREEANCTGDERTGLSILKRALEAPTRQIAENSAFDGGVVVDRMRSGQGNYGFDAAHGQYVDLVQAGIIDPARVVRVALENAVSVASVLLLTEATLTEIPEEKKEHTPHEMAEA